MWKTLYIHIYKKTPLQTRGACMQRGFLLWHEPIYALTFKYYIWRYLYLHWHHHTIQYTALGDKTQVLKMPIIKGFFQGNAIKGSIIFF